MWTTFTFFCLRIVRWSIFGTIFTSFRYNIEKWSLYRTLLTSSRVFIIKGCLHWAEIRWQIGRVDEIFTLTLISIWIKYRSIWTDCTLMQISIIKRLIWWAKSCIVSSHTFCRIDRIDWLSLRTRLASFFICDFWTVNRTLNSYTCSFIIIELFYSRTFYTLSLRLIKIPITFFVTNFTSGDSILIR